MNKAGLSCYGGPVHGHLGPKTHSPENKDDANEPWETSPGRRGWAISAVGKAFSETNLHYTPRSWRVQPPESITCLRGGGYHQQEGSHGGQDENGSKGWNMSWDTPKRWA